MPFDFDDYRGKVKNLSEGKLHEEYRRHCESLGAGSIGWVSGLLLIGFAFVGWSAMITNASTKIAIMKEYKATGH